MKYKIEWWENKTSSKGNAYASTSLSDEQGKQYEVAIFSSFPNFSSLKSGDTVEGELKSKDYNGKVSYTLEAPKLSTTGNFTPKTGAIKQAMEQKEKSIAHFQDNKEWSIILASTMRSAVEIALAECHGMPFDVGVFKSRVKEWRKFLVEEWDKEPKDFNPF